MNKKIYLLLFCFLAALYTVAQKQNANWFFGSNAGLTWKTTANFNATGVYGTPNATLTGIPTNVTGSPMNTLEGCFSISDIDGNLLFFSDGITIWNKNLDVMANGGYLTGNPSSAQSGVIFPFPRSKTQYVALTLGERATDNLSYSIVDMFNYAGLGAVLPGQKNIQFTGQSGILGESVAAARHSNQYDYWVVAPGRTTTNSYLNVWKVTSAGVETAVHSTVTVGKPTIPTAPGGYIKFTQDGRHFAWIDFGTGSNTFFCYGDFDNATGIISNLKVRTGGTGLVNGAGYGLEFTADGKYLYLTYSPGSYNSNTFSALQVFDFNQLLSAPNPDIVMPLKEIVNPQSLANGVNDHFSAIQTGADGRMYISCFYTKSLFVIDNPDDPLNMKIYKLENILTGTARYGLPTFAAPWFRMVIEPPTVAESICAEYPGTFKLLVEDGFGFDKVSKIVFDFGDGSPDAVITYSPAKPGTNSETHTFKTPGTYTVKATAYNADGSVNVTQTIQVTVNTCALRVNPNIRGINN